MTINTASVVDHSQVESDILGLRVCRCNQDYFDENSLYRDIVSGRYDICRVKVSSEDEFAPHRLHQMGLPYFYSGSISRYKTKISQPPTGTYNHPDLEWEYYDGTQDRLLKDMLIDTWGEYPIGYYRTPYLSEILTKEMEIHSVFTFYKKNNNPKSNPSNNIVFIKHGDNYVGFFALNILNGDLESHIGGILRPYRKDGYFLDKLRYIKEYCLQHGLKHFIFGARNENAEVKRIFQYVGFEVRGCENVFHVPSLLSHSQIEPVISPIDIGVGYAGVFSEAIGQLRAIRQIDGHINFNLNKLDAKSTRVKFSYPVVTGKETLMVMQDPHGERSFTGYLRVSNAL